MELKFSKIELHDLTKAWIAVSIAFAIALGGGIAVIAPNSNFLLSIVIAALTVGTGFLLHEMGHKVVAQRYGCFAEFRADNFMLFLAVITSLFGFVFAAPGAVVIAGRVSRERNGKISVAGPLVNIVLALGFLGVGIFVQDGFIGTLATFGALVNSWLAVFNLIPIWILDGKKVLDWNKGVYALVMGLAILLFFARMYLPLPALA